MCIPMASFLEAVDCSFRFNMFRVGRHVFEQRMGSPMGSPISPSLCHAVVPDFEHRVFSNILLLVPSSCVTITDCEQQLRLGAIFGRMLISIFRQMILR